MEPVAVANTMKVPITSANKKNNVLRNKKGHATSQHIPKVI